MPGHWEGDLIKGYANASTVGAPAERSMGCPLLVKVNNATAISAVEGSSAALNRMPVSARKTLTYYHCKEMRIILKSPSVPV